MVALELSLMELEVAEAGSLAPPTPGLTCVVVLDLGSWNLRLSEAWPLEMKDDDLAASSASSPLFEAEDDLRGLSLTSRNRFIMLLLPLLRNS